MFYDEIVQFCDNNSIEYKTNVDSKRISSFRIGGNAPVVVYPETSEQVSGLIRFMNDNSIPFRTVGNCSNILFPDTQLYYVLLKTERLNTLSVENDMITCGAGVILAKAASLALKAHLTGMEHLFGIPGTIGGAVVMNAGAYGTEMSQIVFETEFIDSFGAIKTIKNEMHDFGYRRTFFTDKNYVVTKSTLKLEKGSYGEIKREMKECSLKRVSSQPLDLPSAGSVFKRPQGYFAGKLIQDCGLKGCSVGGAQVSEKHAGFIVNTGDATSEDVKELIKTVQTAVYDRYGIKLETEIKFF